MEGEAGRRIDLKYRCESAMGDNSYTLRGGGRESYAARFTWFVFSEAEIINWPGELQPGDITAEAVYSEVPTSGHFTFFRHADQQDTPDLAAQPDRQHARERGQRLPAPGAIALYR